MIKKILFFGNSKDIKMSRIFFFAILFISPWFKSFGQLQLDKKASNYYYTNPIITGMNPDPSICRVGKDYYLVTSSFGFFPGLPIYHSLDLVHWQRIGYGIDRASQLKLKPKKSDGLNLYAPTIRYHQGTFYIINTNVGRHDKNRNFVITATDPAGPWSDAHYIENAPRIDPSLFFDEDGKVYYTGNDTPKNPTFEKQRNIWMQQIDPETWQLKGDRVVVLDPSDYYLGLKMTGKENPLLNFIEASHLYKKDGVYYLVIANGGTFWNHAVSIFKSKHVFGPYAPDGNNPIVSNRNFSHNSYIHHTGHADLVKTENNTWWMVLLGVRPYGEGYTNLGRETCLVPVDWSGKWPVVNPLGPKGKVMPIHRRPNLKNHPWPKAPARDEFKGKKLKLYWNFMQPPYKKWWKLSENSGQLKIDLRPEVIESGVNPSFIGRRQKDKNFTASTKMTFNPTTEKEVAGMVITRDTGNQFQLICTLKNGKKYLELIRKEVVDDQTEKIVAKAHVTGNIFYLKTSALEEEFTFSYSTDGKTWKTLAAQQDGSLFSFGKGNGRFTGTFIGMYASSNGTESNNSALFDWFEYDGF